jgi:hypothetical protein
MFTVLENYSRRASTSSRVAETFTPQPDERFSAMSVFVVHGFSRDKQNRRCAAPFHKAARVLARGLAQL